MHQCVIMKTPCEIVVWYVLPTIRREIARELVTSYHMKQVDVGRIFGVTDAAISQYLKKKRGASSWIEGSKHYPEFLDEIRISSKRIYDKTSNMSAEMCRICRFIKNIGLLSEVYRGATDSELPQCEWDGISVTQINSA